ncbi:MAG: hypothetical protein ACFE75_07150 [Candidatus Hodarchaeota archaeon]
MGVKLQNIIVRKKIEYQDLRGKVIAVDAPNIIMRLFNFTQKNTDRNDNNLILDRTQRPIFHLYGLLYRVNFYYCKKIFPIFCFDGKVSELKRVITKDQLKDFIFTQRWYQEAMKNGNKELARNIALSKEYMWQNVIKESKQLLGAFGIPYIESPASAESQCANLVKRKLAAYSNSQDFDSLLFGCPHIIQNLSKSMKRKVQGKWQYQKVYPVQIDLQENLRNLGISLFQLIDIGILIGTDYFQGVKNIGPKKALTLIRSYKTLENLILKEFGTYDFSNLTPDIIKQIRKIFLFPEVNDSTQKLYWNLPNKSKVFSLLCKEHNLNRDRVVKNLEILEKNYEKCRDFFIYQNQKPRRIQVKL